MPQMDGIEFIKQLRAKNECKFTPIIMLTTESQEHKKQEGKKAGASGWIVKPFNARQLKDAIKKFIE
jgi:two-component system chemotaxis response regulator CheY